ncbi:MAG TPA: hypothetical protein VGB43_02820 [Flavobacterium sp.]
MEPNKLEKEFAQKLNSREIAPSPAAWDRLDAMLTVTEEAKPVRKLNWLYIAAGFIGFVLMLTIFLSQMNKENNQQDAIVIENTKKVNPTQDVELPDSKRVQPVIHPIPNTNEQVAEAAAPLQRNASQIDRNEENDANNEFTVNQQLADKAAPVSNQFQKLNPAPTVNPDLPKVNVDELLAAATKNSQNPPSNPSVTIDANSLLSQVDDELETSFREKVIKSVSKNYKNVKVALANRNNEN